MKMAFRDHPRICGEKILSGHPPSEHTGSPPHMRGKVPKNLTLGLVIGITPAYAGKSAQ